MWRVSTNKEPPAAPRRVCILRQRTRRRHHFVDVGLAVFALPLRRTPDATKTVRALQREASGVVANPGRSRH